MSDCIKLGLMIYDKTHVKKKTEGRGLKLTKGKINVKIYSPITIFLEVSKRLFRKNSKLHKNGDNTAKFMFLLYF